MRRLVARVPLELEPVQAALQRVVRPEVQVARQAEQPEVQQVVPQEARQVVQQEALPVEQQVAQQREAQRQPVVQPQLVESPER